MFDGIAEHEGRRTELAYAILFYEIAYFLGVDFSRSTNSLIFFLEFIF